MDDILTARDVSARLRVSLATVYALARAGELPSFRVGRSVRFSAAAISGLADRVLIVTPRPNDSRRTTTRRPAAAPDWDAALSGRRARLREKGRA